MRIVAVTYGSEGDSRPMIALCHALRAAGHDASMLADKSAASLAAELEVPFRPFEGDMAEEMKAAGMEVSRRGSDPLFIVQALGALVRAHTTAWMREVLDAARDADAIVGAGLAIYVAQSCADHLRVPMIGAAMQPLLPTAAFPSPFFRQWNMPGFANRLSHRLILALLWRACRGALNDARVEVTGQPKRRAQWPIGPTLMAMSPHLVPPPRDWPFPHEFTGYWWPPQSFTPDAALAGFLAAGEPPVYVGFGSMMGLDPDSMLESLIGALEGRRALLFPGWSRLGTGALPPNIHRIGGVPHTWLFPQVSVAMHHGGAGTTHSAARAGVPSIVFPFAADQPFWAERLRRLGVAPLPVSPRNVSAGVLALRLSEAMSEPMRSRARSLGRSMSREPGVDGAVPVVERWLADPTPSAA